MSVYVEDKLERFDSGAGGLSICDFLAAYERANPPSVMFVIIEYRFYSFLALHDYGVELI